MNIKSWWDRHRKLASAILILTPFSIIGVPLTAMVGSTIVPIISSITANKKQVISEEQYQADKRLMMELSGNRVLSVMKHQERALYIIASPLSKNDLCDIVRNHKDVPIKEMYYVTPVKKKFTCEAFI